MRMPACGHVHFCMLYVTVVYYNRKSFNITWILFYQQCSAPDSHVRTVSL